MMSYEIATLTAFARNDKKERSLRAAGEAISIRPLRHCEPQAKQSHLLIENAR